MVDPVTVVAAIAVAQQLGTAIVKFSGGLDVIQKRWRRSRIEANKSKVRDALARLKTPMVETNDLKQSVRDGLTLFLREKSGSGHWDTVVTVSKRAAEAVRKLLEDVKSHQDDMVDVIGVRRQSELVHLLGLQRQLYEKIAVLPEPDDKEVDRQDVKSLESDLKELYRKVTNIEEKFRSGGKSVSS